jgi:uncharacterized phage-associated protein
VLAFLLENRQKNGYINKDKRRHAMTTAFEVSKYIIKSLPVDNLKLQKLLYYSQGVYLVLHDKKPLFNEVIEAWDYGPVVPLVYQAYKEHGFDIIPPVDDESTLDFEEMKAVDMTLACFGELSGTVLIGQTHYEAPWKNAYRKGRPSGIITNESMYNYFKDALDFED